MPREALRVNTALQESNTPQNKAKPPKAKPERKPFTLIEESPAEFFQSKLDEVGEQVDALKTEIEALEKELLNEQAEIPTEAGMAKIEILERKIAIKKQDLKVLEKEEIRLENAYVKQFERKATEISDRAKKALADRVIETEPGEDFDEDEPTEEILRPAKTPTPRVGPPPVLPPRDDSPDFQGHPPKAVAFGMPKSRVVEDTLDAKPKHSWIPAPVRKWGLKLLVAAGLIAAAGPTAEKLGELDQKINEFGEQYEKGIKSFAESSPLARGEHGESASIPAQTNTEQTPHFEQATQEKAQDLVAGETVEVAGKKVRIAKASVEEAYDGGETLFRGLHEFDRIMEGYQSPEDQLKIDDSLADTIRTVDVAPGTRSEEFKMAYAKYIGQREAAKLYMSRGEADHVDAKRLASARSDFMKVLTTEAEADPNLKAIAEQISGKVEKIS